MLLLQEHHMSATCSKKVSLPQSVMRSSPYLLLPTKYRLSQTLSLCTLKACLCTLNMLFTPWTRHDPSNWSSCCPDIRIRACTLIQGHAHNCSLLGPSMYEEDRPGYRHKLFHFTLDNKNWLVMVEMQRIRLISELLCLHEPLGAVVFSHTASKFWSE